MKYLKNGLTLMINKYLKKLDNVLDRNWQEFYEFCNYIFKQNEYDRDWSQMNKNIKKNNEQKSSKHK